MTHDFLIADFPVRIIFTEGQPNDMRLIPSFLPFERPHHPNDGQARDLPLQSPNDQTTNHLNDQATQHPLFTLLVDDTLATVPRQQRHRIREFDTGNGETIVDRLDNGGYQFIIKDIHNQECALLIADKDFVHLRCALNGNFAMRTFGFVNVLMLSFAYAASNHDTLLLHASLVRHEGKAYAFHAKSGTGKSTHVSLWMKYIPDCDIINDDNPIIRVKPDGVYIYGGPWSGKTPCYRDTQAPLGAIVRIDRAPTNSIEKLPPVEAFVSLLPSVASMKWDEDIWDRICNSATRIIERVPSYTLHCLPDKEAALLCRNSIHTSKR